MADDGRQPLVPHPGHDRPVRVRPPVPRRRRARRPPRRGEYEHARRDRDAGRLHLLRLRHAPARNGDGRRARSRDVLRLGGGDHRPRAAGPMARGPREGPGRWRRPKPPGAAPAHRARPAPRRRARGAGDPGRPRRPAARPPRRAHPGRRRARRRRIGRRRVDAHRRADPGRQGGRRRRHRCDAQHERLLRHARRAGRSGHHPRPDRQPRGARPGLEGADPAPGGSGHRLVRASRPRHRGADLRRLARVRSAAEPAARAVDGDRRAHHRLPVRDGPGDADGDHGRHRQGRRARDPHPRRRRARGCAARHDGRPRQDRHDHARPAGGHRRSMRCAA